MRAALLAGLLLASVSGAASADEPALDPLRWRDDQIARWRAAMTSDNPLQRGRAIAELVALEYRRAPDVVRSAVTDTDYRVRVRALGLIVRSSALSGLVPLVRGRLEDPRAEVRAAAARAAGALGGAGATDELIAGLTDRAAGVRSASVEALRRLSAQRFGFEPAGAEVDRAEAARRWRAWWEQGQGSSPQTRLITSLTASDARTRARSASALAQHSVTRAGVGALIARLSDDKSAVRLAALEALIALTGRADRYDVASQGDTEGATRWQVWWEGARDAAPERWALDLLGAPQARIRAGAARHLADRDRTPAVGALVAAAADKRETVARVVRESLARLTGLRRKDAAGWAAWWVGAQGKTRIEWLSAGLTADDHRLRAAACSGLFRHAGSTAAPLLLGALADPHAVVRERAWLGLRQLTDCELAFDPDGSQASRATQRRAILAWWEQTR